MIHVIIPTCGAVREKTGRPYIFALLDEAIVGCLRSGAVSPGDLSFTVVMNTDDREKRNLLRGQLPIDRCVRLIDIPRKIGYVGAVGLAWESLGWDTQSLYDDDGVVVLNDDVVITGDIFTPMVEALAAGAEQVGPSVKYVGRDGFWGRGDERYIYCEGWCWMATVKTIRDADGIVDPSFAPGYCEDQDLSIRIQREYVDKTCTENIRTYPSEGQIAVPDYAAARSTIRQVSLPIRHEHTKTYGNDRHAAWARNRALLQKKWQLA